MQLGENSNAIFRSEVVRAAGLEPAQVSRPYGFSYHFGFRRRPPKNVRGLDYPFTVASPLSVLPV
jgi:hypothetical protein